MNRFQKLAFRMASKIAGRHPQDPTIAKWWASLFPGAGGVNVNPDTAMRLSALYGAVTLISQVLSMLPFPVYRRVDGGKEKDRSHPLWPILMEQPNRYQTPKEFKEYQQNAVLLTGNAYGEIISTGGQAVAEVLPRKPDSVRPFMAPNGERAYEITEDNGQTRIILQDEMWHIMGPSLDGISGLSPVEYHARTIGTSILAGVYEEKFFENDARPGIILTHPSKLSVEAQGNLVEAWERRHKGADKSHRPGILQEGMTIHELQNNHRDAQFIELLKLGIADIARIYHVPLHMLAEMDRATFSNIEHQNIEFVTYTMMYHLVTWKESASRDLFTPTSRRTHFAEFNVDALLKGDIETRFEAYKKSTGVPWQTVNEIRAMQNLLPVEGGDKLYVPVNMQLAGADPAGDEDG